MKKTIFFLFISILITSCYSDRLQPIRALARSSDLDKKEEASQLYKEAIRTLVNAYSSSAGLNKTIGKQLTTSGFFEKALEHLQTAREIKNTDEEIYHYIAICYVNLYKIDKSPEKLSLAKENYQYALNLSPNSRGILYDYAQLLVFGTQEYSLAIETLNHYLYDLNTEDKNGYFLLGRSLFAIGEYNKAYQVFTSIYQFEKNLTTEEKETLQEFITETASRRG